MTSLQLRSRWTASNEIPNPIRHQRDHHLRSVAVELDLVNPVAPLWWFLHKVGINGSTNFKRMN